MKTKPKLLIFDVDGTLVDSLTQSYKVDKTLVERYGGHIPSLDAYREAIGMGDWGSFYKTFGINDPELKAALLKEYYAETAKVPLRAAPGAEGLLYFLKGKLSTSIVSINKSRANVLAKLRSSGLEKYFDKESIRVADTTKTKEIMKECERKAVSCGSAFFIGDTAKDVIEARGTGTRTVAISWSGSYHNKKTIEQSNPDYLFDDLKQVLNLLEG